MTKEEITIPRPADALLQKNRFSLLCSGNALITFAIWTVIRSIIQLYFFFQTGLVEKDMPLQTVAILVLILGIVDLALKLYVGLSARAQALGKHRKDTYIALGILLAVVSLVWLISQLPLISNYYHSNGLLQVVISLAVEMTVLFAELDLVISAIRVRKIEKEAAVQNKEPEGAR